MMRNQEFESLVKAKRALKTHIFVDEVAADKLGGDQPEDHEFNVAYSTKSMYSPSMVMRREGQAPEPVHSSKVEAEITPA